MMKRYFIPFFLISSATLIGLTLFSERLVFPDSTIKFLGESKRIELTSGKPVTQIFVIPRNQFSGFQLFMGDTDLALGESLEFSLLDPTCSTTLRKMTRTALTLPVSRELRFLFDPISDSSWNTYCLSIRFDQKLNKRTERPFIRATENVSFGNQSYTDMGKNKTYTGRSLQVRPLYSESGLTNRLQQLENRLSQYKPVLFKGYVLAIGGLTVFLGMIFFWLISRKAED